MTADLKLTPTEGTGAHLLGAADQNGHLTSIALGEQRFQLSWVACLVDETHRSLVPTITFTAAFWNRALTTSSPLDYVFVRTLELPIKSQPLMCNARFRTQRTFGVIP
jgi:hypothetical protein